MSDELFRALRRVEADIALLKSRHERMFRYGKILDDKDIDVSDATKPRARIEIEPKAGEEPVKGPWLPYATVAGARNHHNPPSKNQQFMLVAPDGNLEQGLLIPLSHWNDVKSPSTDPKTYIDQIGKTKNTQKDGSWTQEVEKASIVLTKGKIEIKAGDTTVTFEDGKVTFDTKSVKFGKNADKPMSMKGTVDTGGDTDQGPFSSIAMTE